MVTRSLEQLALIALVAIAACDQQHRVGSGVSNSADSVKIMVIDTSALTHYTMAARPEFAIGADPANGFVRVIGALKLGDGNTLIAQGHDRVLLVVDAAGHVIRRLGRKGDGPGEFELLGRPLRALNDQVVTLDLRLRRLTWLPTLVSCGQRNCSRQPPCRNPARLAC